MIVDWVEVVLYWWNLSGQAMMLRVVSLFVVGA
jgi:hypothetical protein